MMELPLEKESGIFMKREEGRGITSGLLSCILRFRWRSYVGGPLWGENSKSRRVPSCFDQSSVPGLWAQGKINSHNEKGTQAVNTKYPLLEQRKIQ